MSRENVALVQARVRAWLRGDLDAWLELGRGLGWDISTHPLPAFRTTGAGASPDGGHDRRLPERWTDDSGN